MSAHYHHGDLPAALRAATAELITERGPSGFSLREVARRAGVSHAAPAHHFGDAKGLITAVATEGFSTLASALEAATSGIDDARERLRACGQAYIRTAQDYPGHFAVIFQADLIDNLNDQCIAESSRAYEQLLRTVTMVRDQLNPGLDIGIGTTFVWAGVQGLVALTPKLDLVADLNNTETAPLTELVDRFVDLMINGLTAR